MASKTLILNNVRLYWADLFEPAKDSQDNKTGRVIKGKYGCTVIIDPASASGKAAGAAVLEVAKAEWGPNAPTVLKALDSKKKALRDGNSYLDKDGAIRPDFADMLYLAAKNELKPLVIAKGFHNGKPVSLSADGRTFQDGVEIHLPVECKVPYRGCYVNLKVSIDAYTSKNAEVGRQVAAKVLAVQFMADGDAFGAAPPTADGFGDMGSDEPQAYDPLGSF